MIGAGSAGLVTSYVAAAAKAKRHADRARADGRRLPEHRLRAQQGHHPFGQDRHPTFRRADEFGLKAGPVEVDFPAVMQRVRDVIAKVEPHDSVERYTGLGVDCIDWQRAHRVALGSRSERPSHHQTRSIVIATGGRPFVPPIPGIDEVDYVTSDTIWKLDALPRRLLVLGGGSDRQRTGPGLQRDWAAKSRRSKKAPRILGREDPEETSQAVMDAFRRRRHSKLLTGFTAERFLRDGDEQISRLRRTRTARSAWRSTRSWSRSVVAPTPTGWRSRMPA